MITSSVARFQISVECKHITSHLIYWHCKDKIMARIAEKYGNLRETVEIGFFLVWFGFPLSAEIVWVVPALWWIFTLGSNSQCSLEKWPETNLLQQETSSIRRTAETSRNKLLWNLNTRAKRQIFEKIWRYHYIVSVFCEQMVICIVCLLLFFVPVMMQPWPGHLCKCDFWSVWPTLLNKS